VVTGCVKVDDVVTDSVAVVSAVSVREFVSAVERLAVKSRDGDFVGGGVYVGEMVMTCVPVSVGGGVTVLERVTVLETETVPDDELCC